MMWDFQVNGGRRSPLPPPPPQMPSPAFPTPGARSDSFSHTGTFGSSYPPLPLYGSTSPPYSAHSDSFPFPAATRPISRDVHYPSASTHYTAPTGQSIVIHHSTHHKASTTYRRQRRHSYAVNASMPSPAPQTVPQVPIYPTASYSSSRPTIIYPPMHSYPGPSVPNTSQARPSGSQNYPSQAKPPKKLTKPSASGSGDQYYSRCNGGRKALCIGINYKGQSNELRGCINDAKRVRKFLIEKGGYRPENIVLLTDDVSDARQLPTRKNIIAGMKWLVRDAQKDDALFLHYSGHGGQTPDVDGDELDGFDEVIFPLDFKKNGHITDDEMHKLMVAPLPPRCRLTALLDACHSGTVLDLPYIYSSHGRLKGSHVSDKSRKDKSTFADVISWSGCQDGQTSADTFHNGVAVGAMSHAFIDSLTNRPNQSYQELLRSVRLILHPRYSQKPQLGSSHHIDTGLKFVF